MNRFKILFASVMFLGITSCDTEVYSDYAFQESENASQTNNCPKTWQEQLEYAQNLGKTTKADNVGIQLIDYQYRGNIESEKDKENIISELFSDNAYVVLYTSFPSFEIITIKELKERAAKHKFQILMDEAIEKVKSQVEVGMQLIDLIWSYNDNIYNSTAIVSNEKGGIVYESIGYFIISSHEENCSNYTKGGKVTRSGIKRVKSRSEVDADVIKEFYKDGNLKNSEGISVATYELTCSSYFKDNILVDRELNSSYFHMPLWSCSASIATVSGEIGVSDYHEFAWGYTYGQGTINLYFNGSVFSYSGVGTGETGTEIHRAE